MRKLHNKKTGEEYEPASKDAIDVYFYVPVADGVALTKRSYGSISKLNEEWEDCDPEDEPFIENEIIRKALKWWAVSNGITNDASLLFVGAANGFTCEDQYISFDSAVYDMSEKLISGNTYDLEELCGEEGE